MGDRGDLAVSTKPMVNAQNVALVCVTRGDVELPALFGPTGEVVIWDNAKAAEDMSVYGRYAALDMVTKDVVIVQDDDVGLSTEAIDGLLAAYEPGKIVANVPPEYRERYTDSTLVGFGAIFDRDLPAKAFARFREHVAYADEQTFRRTCDIVFTVLTPFTLVDLPFTYLPHTRAPNRMYRQPGNFEERQRMLKLAREVRDARK